jgi:hypothetical protein
VEYCAAALANRKKPLAYFHRIDRFLQTYPATVPCLAGLLISPQACSGREVDVRPNWKEQAPTESLTGSSGVEPAEILWAQTAERRWRASYATLAPASGGAVGSQADNYDQ